MEMDGTGFQIHAQDLPRHSGDEKPAVIAAVNPANSSDLAPPTRSCSGQDLLRPKITEPMIWYIVVTVIYTFVAFAILIWIGSGPDIGNGRRVLRTGVAAVDQFYSGLALSAILTPAAVVIRKLSQEFAKIHPFSLAGHKPVLTSDMNKIVNPGLLDLPCLWRYSKWIAVVQAMLMLGGTLLVPLGTLIITTGVYAPQLSSIGVVGLPTTANELRPGLSDDDRLYVSGFATNIAATLVEGTIISNVGVLGTTKPVLGPVATENITFETGVRYENVVAFTWDAGCESAEADISFTIDPPPDGENPVVEDGGITYIPLAANITYNSFNGSNGTTGILSQRLLVWSNATDDVMLQTNPFALNNLVTAPSGGTLFFAIAGDKRYTASWPANLSSLTNSSNYWVSRVKCTPNFTWNPSSCSWDGSSMTDCAPTPGANTPWLDTVGLNFLSQWMTTVLFLVASDWTTALGMTISSLPLLYWSEGNTNDNTTLIRAPGLEDYTNFFGVAAQSLVTTATSGAYGTATVPTVGQPERAVYIARLYMLAIVFLLLLAVAALSIADMVSSRWQKLPFLKADFLAIASAVRGPWWDQELYGGVDIAGRRAWQFVMFGEDPSAPERVGLAPVARRIRSNAWYHAVK